LTSTKNDKVLLRRNGSTVQWSIGRVCLHDLKIAGVDKLNA
jgi:hypothetical protein